MMITYTLSVQRDASFSQLVRMHWRREFLPPCLKTDKMAELSHEEFKKNLFTTFRSRGVLEALKVSLNVKYLWKFEVYNLKHSFTNDTFGVLPWCE